MVNRIKVKICVVIIASSSILGGGLTCSKIAVADEPVVQRQVTSETSDKDLNERIQKLVESITTDKPPYGGEATLRLRKLVDRLFELRLNTQRERIEGLRAELNKLEMQLTQQETNRQTLVDDRVAAILANPSLLKVENGTEVTTIELGDVLAVHIPGVLPYDKPGAVPENPPITMVNDRPVTGYPIAVDDKGQVTLPFIDPIKVVGLTGDEAAEKMRTAYISKSVLVPTMSLPAVTIVKQKDAAANCLSKCQEAHYHRGWRYRGDLSARYLTDGHAWNEPHRTPINTIDDQLVTGYPLVVMDTGEITLYLVGNIKVAGLTVSEATNAISQLVIDKRILSEETATPILTLIKAK